MNSASGLLPEFHFTMFAACWVTVQYCDLSDRGQGPAVSAVRANWGFLGVKRRHRKARAMRAASKKNPRATRADRVGATRRDETFKKPRTPAGWPCPWLEPFTYIVW